MPGCIGAVGAIDVRILQGGGNPWGRIMNPKRVYGFIYLNIGIIVVSRVFNVKKNPKRVYGFIYLNIGIIVVSRVFNVKKNPKRVYGFIYLNIGIIVVSRVFNVKKNPKGFMDSYTLI